MQTMFKNFQVISHTFINGRDSLVVRMHATGMHYTLVRGLDPFFGGLFKLEIDGDFYRTPRSNGGAARSVITNNRVCVEFTCADLTRITQAGW